MTPEKYVLLHQIRQGIADYICRHKSCPHRVWVSRGAGLVLLDELNTSPELFDVPLMVTTDLAGISFAMINSRAFFNHRFELQRQGSLEN